MLFGMEEINYLNCLGEVHLRQVFPERIRELGGRIDTPPVYRSINPQVTHKGLKRFLRERKITVATFTSAATFNNLIESVGNETVALLKDAAIAVIGPVTKRAVEKAGLKVEIMPQKATVAAMAEAIIEWVGGSKNSPVETCQTVRTLV
jgi:uroporphyrinogen III methyltransferase/synthase